MDLSRPCSLVFVGFWISPEFLNHSVDWMICTPANLFLLLKSHGSDFFYKVVNFLFSFLLLDPIPPTYLAIYCLNLRLSVISDNDTLDQRISCVEEQKKKNRKTFHGQFFYSCLCDCSSLPFLKVVANCFSHIGERQLLTSK